MRRVTLAALSAVATLACAPPGREPAVRGHAETSGTATHTLGTPAAPSAARAGATFMETRDLYRLGRQTASGAVPDEWRQSLPIPVRRDGLSVVFLFVPQRARPGESSLLGAPDYRSMIRAADGRLLSLESIPQVPNLERAESEGVIGTFGLPEGMTAAEFLQRQDELFAAYDTLLPYYARGETDLGAHGREWARRFVQIFELLSEPPLRPYYTQYGGDFFHWVSGVAGT